MRKTIGRAILYFLAPTGCLIPTGEFAKRADIDNIESRISKLEQCTISVEVKTDEQLSALNRLISAPKPKAKAKARGRKNGKA